MMNLPTMTDTAPWLVSSRKMTSRLCLILLVEILLVASSSQTGKDVENLTNRDDSSNGFSSKIIKTPYNLKELFEHPSHCHGFNATWISGSEMFYFSEQDQNFVSLDLGTMELKNTSIQLGSEDVQNSLEISPTKSYILVRRQSDQQSRHFGLKRYSLIHIPSFQRHQVADGADVAFIQWLPKRNDFVYVLENNIYHAQITDTGVKVTKLTDDGVPRVVFNGVPDSVYKEEVLCSKGAIWVSPNGNHLVFAKFNDTEVQKVTNRYYGEPGSLRDQYATQEETRWPKVGTANPIVTLHLVDLSNLHSSMINLEAPIDTVGKDHILEAIDWLDNERIAVSWSNRSRNHVQMVVYDTMGRENKLLSLSEENAWVDAPSPIYYHDGYLILPKLQESGTEAGKAKHVTRYSYNDNQLLEETDLTPGTIEVHTLYGVDKLNARIYFLGNEIETSSQVRLYSVSILGNEKPRCISCNVITPEGNNCTYAGARFSPDMSHYVLYCGGPDVPFIRIYDQGDRQLLEWEPNTELREKLVRKMSPQIRDLTVSSHGFESKVRFFLPPDFDEKKSYPMLVQTYAAPNSALILDVARYDFEAYMATNRSVIYAWIDGRGSAHRGSKLLHQIYKKFGVVEVEDLIAVTKYLHKTYSWIDAERTGIWGWSYGGYVSAMVLATDVEHVFKCAMSVAPISSWLYFDSIYTEKYMGLPTEEDNLHGYNNSDVTTLVNGMRDKRFMLIHGTDDKYAYQQQSMALVKALHRANIPFELVTYPDEDHYFMGVRPHLYDTMDRFWRNCFD